MTTAARAATADYDSFAWFYRRHWCSHYHGWAFDVLDRILLPRLAPGASVLDLCCGVGTLSRPLVERGYRVTGVDRSAAMIRFARQDVPGASFLEADARAFRMPAAFDAAVCAFDSLNHFLDAAELRAVLANVHASLVPGGAFAFDINLEDAFLRYWNESCTVVEDDNAFFVRGGYDGRTRLGRTEITMFRHLREWRRSDATLYQRCYPAAEWEAMLTDAGFTSVRMYDVPRDLGIEGQPGNGRAFVLALKSGPTTPPAA